MSLESKHLPKQEIANTLTVTMFESIEPKIRLTSIVVSWAMRTCITVLVMFIVSGGCKMLPEPVFSPSEPHLRIVTYNVNWGFARPQNVVNYLVKTDADVVFLQETHRHWEVFFEGTNWMVLSTHHI